MQKNLIDALIDLYIRLVIFGYSFDEPTLWASGTYNPPYINNRRLASSPDGRKVIGELLPSLIEDKSAVDYVYPIPNGGIPWATLLALKIDKPMLIKHGNSYYHLDLHALKTFSTYIMDEQMRFSDTVAGTIPLGIILGIILAEKMNKNFLFVRPKPKDHGTGERVEGLVYQNLNYKAVVIDPVSFGGKGYTEDAVIALKGKGNIIVLRTYQYPFDGLLDEVNIKGKNIVAVEDVVSTGESMMKELEDLMKLGANILPPLAIFNYELLSTITYFAKKNLEVKSLVNFKKLIDVYDGKGLLPTPDSKMLIGWFNNQATWGINNGFVKK